MLACGESNGFNTPIDLRTQDNNSPTNKHFNTSTSSKNNQYYTQVKLTNKSTINISMRKKITSQLYARVYLKKISKKKITKLHSNNKVGSS